MWGEVINGISDGRKLGTEDAKKLAQLKEKAVKHATVWQTHIREQLASDRGFQQTHLRNTAPWVYSFQPIKADVLIWLSRNQSVKSPFGTYN